MSKLEDKREELEERLLDQLTEDRALVKDMYEKLSLLTTNIQEFAMNGLTMVKLLELAQKQTAEISDVLKSHKKKDNENSVSLNSSETEELWTNIEKK